MAGGAFVAGEAYFDAFAGQRVDVHLGPFDEYQMPAAETRPASTRLSRWYETVWTEISLCLAISDAGAGPPSSTMQYGPGSFGAKCIEDGFGALAIKVDRQSLARRVVDGGPMGGEGWT